MDGRRGPGDLFTGFGGYGGSADHGSFISSFFGGRNPFDDPFFSSPFGRMPQPGFFGGGGSPFLNYPRDVFFENQVQPNGSRGPIIEEINSEDEEEENIEQKNVKSRKHPRSRMGKEAVDEVEERRSKQMQSMNRTNMLNNVQTHPLAHSFTYQSSSFSYSGANGAYYTSSKARRIGSDGLTFEETKEADSSTGEASHQISRGIFDKGHSLSRKLKSDGKVDTMQTLHNLNEGEVAGFEADWQRKAKQQMPQLAQSFINQGFIGSGNRQIDGGNRRGWALPSTEPGEQSRQPVEPAEQPRRMKSDGGKTGTDHSMWKKVSSKK
uniref:Myeloid leukemia factor n=1 Tax=Kalanchoe fedtschenkoi TaxID=63787 RepID=A0A7N0V7R3_KALFE